jgi:hypothetical protein
MKYSLFLFSFLLFSLTAFADPTPPLANPNASEDRDVTLFQGIIAKTLETRWYERIKMKGYAHFRYNRLLETNGKLTCPQCDRSMGKNQGFFFRRARLNFYGDVTDRMYIHIQPDYATSTAPTGQNENYLQIRDAYFDYALIKSKELRLRTGQSKVPFGFETLQSSSVRAPIDRADAIDMGVPNEYDTGLFLMYAPTQVRNYFKELATPALKGTGDYGMLTVGAYNGQSLNRREANNDLHRVVRFTYPIKLANGQFIEPSLSAYEGKFNINGKNYYDSRQTAAFVMYPQPFGFQAEYNVGVGPEFDPSVSKIRVKNLSGGYVLVNHNFYVGDHRILPYVRFQEYRGGKKLEDGRLNKVREWELGTEWQPNPGVKLTAGYAIADRLTQGQLSSTAAPGARSHQKGNLLRLQAQFNY